MALNHLIILQCGAATDAEQLVKADHDHAHKHDRPHDQQHGHHFFKMFHLASLRYLQNLFHLIHLIPDELHARLVNQNGRRRRRELRLRQTHFALLIRNKGTVFDEGCTRNDIR